MKPHETKMSAEQAGATSKLKWPDSHRPVSPAPSDVSLKSDRSKADPLNFKDGEPGWRDHNRPVSPAPSDVSLKSNRSKADPLNFTDGEPGWPDSHRPVSPAPSDVSLKSDRSKADPLNFTDGETGWPDHNRPVSPAPSDVSLKSNRSKADPLNFTDGEPGWTDSLRPVSPAPSDVSLKSDRSKADPLNFTDGETGWPDHNRPVSPAPSDVSLKSNRSKADPLNFTDGEPGWTDSLRPVSPAPSDVSLKSDRSKADPLNFTDGETGWPDHNRPVSPAPSDVSLKSNRSKADPLNFTDGEPGWPDSHRPVSPAPSDFSLKSDRSKADPLNFTDGEPGPLEIKRPVASASRTPPQNDPLDFTSEFSSPDGNAGTTAPSSASVETGALKQQKQLISPRKGRFLRENTGDEVKNHPNQKNTEHIIREEDGRKTAVTATSDIFKDTKGQTIRTVLTVGETGVGKSFLVQKLITEWAEKKPLVTRATSAIKSFLWGANDEEVLFPLRFSDLHLTKGKKYSLVALLNDFLEETKEYYFEQFKVLFILDGLDDYQLPLDFKNSDIVTDIRKQASVDVLLTNLIRGDLFPSARVWITSRPSAASRLLEKHVDRMTEIRYTFKHKLTADLKRCMLSQHEEDLKKSETDTELYEIKKNEEERIQTYDTLFKNPGKNKGQTMLMIGAPGVGKTFQTRKFMVDWAMEKSNRNIDFIVSFDFSKLNSRKDEVQSMTDLLHQSLSNDKQPGVCNYGDCKVAFVLDGLEKCELPLNFKNNKDLTNMEQPASMDVLLTNLIKGKLLPSALVWIVSQPSGVNKIPPKHIQKKIECRDKDFKHELTANLKVTVCRQHEEELKKNETDTEVYEKGEKNKAQTFETLFQSSKRDKVRTVLMTGAPGVGKTFQTRRFMVDWAKEKSNTNIDLIVSFDFSELNLRKDEDQSMADLLRQSLNDYEHRRPCRYDNCKVAIVLDGLEKCELPLNFKTNKDLTDMEERAPMDVLLTNLIKGKLLPSALLWIVSQPSGVQKIPQGHIQKQIECRGGVFKHELTADLKEEIINQHKQDLSKHETDTELYEMKEKKKIESYDTLFQKSHTERVRTLLMTGAPDVGKTFQTRSFMLDWALEKSNRNIDFIVSFDFGQLNSRKGESQSMTDLLRQSLKDNKHKRACRYADCEVAVVLDGLEKCELPLDFKNNKDLTNMEQPASMDVLLTNLIKGKLLPSALLWIVSQPSGVNKIPPKHIQKKIECRDKDFKHELTANLKIAVCRQHEEELKKNETDTEVYEKGEKNKAQTFETLFQSSKRDKVRTVLMTGAPGVGKTFQTRRFMVDWAREKSNTNIDLIVSFNFSELNLRKDKDQSMADLLRQSLNDYEHRRPCRYDNCKVAIVLDGLEKCELPLDFENNKDLTDMEERAPMDVLLTNLIKGKLLPSALLWIVSQPSGVNKIPRGHIQKQIECRGGVFKHELTADLKKKIQYGEQGPDLSASGTSVNNDHSEGQALSLTEEDQGVCGEQGPDSPTSGTSVKNDHSEGQALSVTEEGQGSPDGNQGMTAPSSASMETDESKSGDACRKETLKQQKPLISALRERFLRENTEDGDQNHPNQKNTQHMMRGEDGSETPVTAVSDIFEDKTGKKGKKVRTVLTVGEAGVGKSFHVQKLIKEWAKNDKGSFLTWASGWFFGKAKDDELVILPLRFSELNLIKEEKYSLMELVNHFLEETKEYDCEKFKVLFILDGLNNYEPPLDFEKSDKVTDIRERASVDVLLTNLIRGDLFPSARVWITSQPSAASRLPGTCVDQMTEIRYTFKHKLTTDLKSRILSQHEEEVRKPEIDTELYEIGEKNKEEIIQSYDTLFKKMGKDEVRTVLMTEAPGVGKTFQTKRFMVDWAKEKSNTNIDFIVPFDFSELNSKKDDVQSMTDLLHQSLSNAKQPGVCNYSDCKVAIVLDGLEKCELPLDFENNKDLTDMEERASMDVLLTNLIKGKLLPSALLWIVSQPSGVNKIPAEYIQKRIECRADLKKKIQYGEQGLDSSVKNDHSEGQALSLTEEDQGVCGEEEPDSPTSDTSVKNDHSEGQALSLTEEDQGSPNGNQGMTAPSSTSMETDESKSGDACRKETLKQRKPLISALRERFLKENTEDEDQNHPNQKNTQHMMRGEDGSETPVTAISDILKDKTGKKGKKVRTVLTVGETGVGKSFHVQKLIKEWAKNDKGSFLTWAELVILPLRFSDLNLIKEKKYSLVELVNHFLEETKEYDCEQLKVLFILDGLNNYEPPLDFEKSDKVTDIRERASVDVLLTNLIRGDLFPSARVWITSRPSAASRLPEKWVDRTTEIRYTFKHKLTTDLKSRILSQHEEEVRKPEIDTELYEIGEKNKEEIIRSYDTLFKKMGKDEVRTVLMTGAPGVGKTFQTKRFMVDWAKEKSNSNIDFIVPFDFSELNSKKDAKQSMTDLLHQSLSNDKQPGVCNYGDCKVAIVLDSLEKCELPLNFEKYKDLTDMKKRASMDVLLTNLIKGKLLPSALLWIVSQPSGVNKIPAKYIQKKIECRDKDFKHELTANLKVTVCRQHEEELKKNETDTEVYEKGEKNKAQTFGTLFQSSKRDKVRAVLMTGAPGVGKTFQTRRFMVDWARDKSNTNIDFIVSFDFSELNLRRDKDQSMADLLRQSLNDYEHRRPCRYDSCKVAIVLDGLEKCELPLNFKTNKDLTDMEEPASMDVLLTNLIKGKLLPSALLWIVSQPSGVQKIPQGHIRKQIECRGGVFKHELTADLKEEIINQHKQELNKHETDTELYKMKEKKKIQSYDTLFQKSHTERVRTLLMTGAPDVGKTFQTRRFMLDWALEKSNRNADFIVSFDFGQLNSRKGESQSMTDLLRQSLKDNKHKRACRYADCEVAVVLDGLEKCELPLDFENNKDLTDMEEPASMDVLLTNLIKGKLLPSALLWIVSQPSGVDKIPAGYIKKRIECRYKDFKHELTADLKETIRRDHEMELSKHESDTDLYEQGEQNKPQTYKTLFHDPKNNEVQRVLMTGVPGVGKTFQTRRFMVDWAKANSSKLPSPADLIVSFNVSDLSSRKGESTSMTDLLCQSLNDNKRRKPCRYDKCKVVVVLDGLEKCELPLDFENNKDLTDMEEPASMDVLLTNLIKGKLLPSALLWIISQPSGVDKIPAEYIKKRIECRYKDFKHELTADLRETIRRDHETELSKHESDTELYEQGEQNKPQTYKTLFHDPKNNEVRTVLMTGVPGVGKTFQTRRFMVDWAKANSSKLPSPADLIVSFNASDLSSRKGESTSMTDLLCQSLNDNKRRKPCRYDKCKVVVILDGLEKCELPLDFENNKDLTDMEEPASMDVLLTNLIKGKLLPSALLWIVSQPSGVDKIPAEYIKKRIECRETSGRRQKLISMLRERFKRENTENEDMDHPNQKTTEHIVREDGRSEEESDRRAKSVTKVAAVSDIFKDTEKQKIRTVLTVGEADIGKTFHVQKFIKQWANSDKQSVFTWFVNSVIGGSPKNEEILFLLNFSRLNLVKEEKYSLVGLLNRFYKETKACVISNFEQFKVLFVLDGLDDFEPNLDFDDSNNLTDARETASVDVLLTNLIKGTLFPSALVWITSRPSAASRLPEECVDRKTEIRCKPHIVSHRKLKTQLKEQFTHVSEGIDQTCALLNNIYTDLYIIEGERGEVNEQHEARQVQDAKFKPETQETLIKYQEIFKPKSEESIRTVLTIGVAGIGKSFATMKYMLDWAEGTANEDIYYMFPLSFRELNLRKEENLSMEELINLFSPAMKTSEITDYDKYNILIVLDGFDECRLDLDFSDSKHCMAVHEKTSVNVLLTNLIQGNLLSEAKIWITSRPAASNHIPAGKVDRVTEVRGFNDEQKDEYFRKRISDKALADKILQHVKKSRSLYIMCHIPVFCWITSKVLEDFVERNQEGQMPKALTDMYIGFLLLQCRQANVKYHGEKMGESSDSCWNARNQETIISLGKLAFENLEKGNPLFTEDDLTDSGVVFTEAVVFSGLFTQIKREGFGTTQDKLFCFVHLSIQEFMAALYVSHTFSTKGENLLTKPTSTTEDLDFYKTAVDKALESKNGDWDLFLRFLLGLSLDSNQNLLKELLKKKENSKQINMKTIEYIKEKIQKENSDADKNFNLFHCLNELNDHSLVKEVKKYLQSETLTFESFSTSQWAALTYVLLTSDEKLDVFELKKYLKSETVLLGMMPVVKVSKTALLSWSELSEKSCQGLTSSVLSSASSNLTVLDLSHNDLLDSGVEKLADGLKSLHCQLEVLKLSGCQVTEKGCSSLALALESKTNSSLKQLDLSYNHPGVNGVTVLSATAPYRNMSLAVCFDHGGESRLQPGLKKYGADLTLDENTASRRLVLFEGNRKVKTFKKVEEKVPRPQSEDRFRRTQVFCQEGLRGFCYWEVEWKGVVGIAMAYRGVGRRWDRSGGLGCNDKSWSLLCCKEGYTAIHGRESKPIERPPCPKIGVLLDWEGGTVTYYSVTSGKLSLIHTFSAKFTEPLFPGFWFKRGSVTLCEIEGISL